MTQKTAQIDISPGEFFDRLTILKLKTKRLEGSKQRQCEAERALLSAQGAPWLKSRFTEPALARKVDLLAEVNTRLWDVEDSIRALDGKVFPIDLDRAAEDEDYAQDVMLYMSAARTVYLYNDERGFCKSRINAHFGVPAEVKEYSKYEVKDDRTTAKPG